MAPTVSIILPTHRNDSLLRRAMGSMLTQSFHDFELIVVWDGLKPSEAQLVDLSQGDPRVRFLFSEGKGIEDALNLGLSKADGKFIARMDGDDVSLPDRLDKQLDYLSSRKAMIVGCQMRIIDGSGEHLSTTRYPSVIKPSRIHRPLRSLVGHPTIMLHRSIIEEAMGYRKGFNRAEDLDLWNRILSKYEIHNLSDVLFDYSSSKTDEKQLMTQLDSSLRAVSIVCDIQGREFRQGMQAHLRRLVAKSYYRFICRHSVEAEKASFDLRQKVMYALGFVVYSYSWIRRGGRLTRKVPR